MAISKVVLHDDSGADRTLVDLTGDTVAPETLMEGATAHDKAGNPIKGTAKPGSGGKQVQSDWAENNPKSRAYVKNRFGGYEEVSEEVIFPAQDVVFDVDGYAEVAEELPMMIGDNVKVIIGGKEYTDTAKAIIPGLSYSYVGNPLFATGEGDNGKPYCVIVYFGDGYSEFDVSSGEGTVNVSISKLAKSVVKIDPKYLPTPLDPLPPITPDDESAFLQVTDGKAGWNKLGVRSEKALNEWTEEEWTKYGAVYDAGGSVECVSYTGDLATVLYLNAVYKDALIVSENVSEYYAYGRFRDEFAFSNNEVQNTAILAIEDGPNERGPMKRLKIKSSTPGSAKEFFITVDDTGTIKATEVV